ncbi:MAG: orotate phosphoribosyltransferase [Bacteroidales bacterium]|jgi:orotate phosphoribosyltransferase|nr:orotate phosphoribosyltransferase [Bacteroidales bacterium]MCR5114698.1 orotate phosphoribosyltransferase [Bacteroidales bacterium]
MNYSEALLSIGAVFLRPDEPFTWASGIKSPIYCDNRLILSAPEQRYEIEHGLAEQVRAHFPDCEMLMGTATAGIAHAALVADIMGLPMGYVRSSSKSHGRNNQIEGKLTKGARVVVIEDLISTGGSCLEVVHALRDAGAEVLGVISIFTYGLACATDAFNAAGVKSHSLVCLDELVGDAVRYGYIREEQRGMVLAFRDSLNR